MPTQTIRRAISYWRIHVFTNLGLFALTVILSLPGIHSGFPAAIEYAGPLRYACDFLAIGFLIAASEWGWRRWLPVMCVLLAARGIWMIARLQHWSIANPIDLVLNACVLGFYTVHYVRKRERRLLDHLKFVWVSSISAIGLMPFVHFNAKAEFCIAMAFSTVLHVILCLQWLDRNRMPESAADWDFNTAKAARIELKKR